MKKNANYVLLLFSISLILLAIIIITITIFMKSNINTSDDTTESEQFTMGYSIYDLSEEDRELFEQLQNEGVQFLEIIRIVTPEEYEKLKEHPFLFNMMEKYDKH